MEPGAQQTRCEGFRAPSPQPQQHLQRPPPFTCTLRTPMHSLCGWESTVGAVDALDRTHQHEWGLRRQWIEIDSGGLQAGTGWASPGRRPAPPGIVL